MNRETLRWLKSLPMREFERAVNATVEDEIEKARAYHYNNAFASVFTAMHDRYPDIMTGDILHSIAVDTIAYVNGIDPPKELAERLREQTGFDVYQPPSKSSLNYIEKGQMNDNQRK